jgi:hypothetical protein
LPDGINYIEGGNEYFSTFMINMTCNGVNKRYNWIPGYSKFNITDRSFTWNPVAESLASAFFGYNRTKFTENVCKPFICSEGSKTEFNLINKYCSGGDVWGNYSFKECISNSWFNKYLTNMSQKCFNGCLNGQCLEPICINGEIRECGTSNIGECKKGIQVCSGNSWGNCIGAVNPINEICDGKDNDCDGSTDEGNVCFVCNNGEKRNYFSNDFCSGFNVLTNSSYEMCVSNQWQTFILNNIFKENCFAPVKFENQYCSQNGVDLISNFSEPACAFGGCYRDYYQTSFECEYGCNSELNECNPPTDEPTCSVDYLESLDGRNDFSISASKYINQVGLYSVHGYAYANSDSFVLKRVDYKRTSPDTKIPSGTGWEIAGFSNVLDFFWKTSAISDDRSYSEGNHSVCCRAQSQKCFNEEETNCEVKLGEILCSSFCIDNSNPVINILSFASMNSWNSNSFNWTWTINDNGCAGIDYYNIKILDSTSDVILKDESHSNKDSFLLTNLSNNHAYSLNITAIDKAGNLKSESAYLFINLTSDNIDFDGDDYNNTADCDDSNPLIHPYAVEECNLIDDDCDGFIDESGVCDNDNDDNDDGDDSYSSETSKKTISEDLTVTSKNITNSSIYINSKKSEFSHDYKWFLWIIIFAITFLLIIILITLFVKYFK